MKYPKLWNGSSPVGEALVRALQRTGAPFLNAHTADGVWAGKMGYRLSEVKQGNPPQYLTWETLWVDDATPSHTAYSIRGFRKFRKGALLTDEAPARYSVYASPANVAHFDGAYALVGSLPGYVGVEAWRHDVLMAKRDGAVSHRFTVYAEPNSYPHFVFPAKLDGVWTQGFTNSWAAANNSGRGTEFLRISRDTETGQWLLEPTTIYADRRDARVYRTHPDELVIYSTRAVGEVGGPWDFVASHRIGDGRGEVWTPFSEPIYQSLFSVVQSGDIGFSVTLLNLELARHCAIAPLDDGNVLMIAAAMTATDGENRMSFDFANAPLYDHTDPGVPTSGITIMKGPIGGMELVTRIAVPDMALVADHIAVSGSKVMAVLRARRITNFLGSTLNPEYLTSEAILIYSDDHGETWDGIFVGIQNRNIGMVSVAQNGKFLLPARIEPGDTWGVFELTDLDNWRLVGKLKALNEGVGRMAAVFDVSRLSRPTPAQPWLSNDAITPPWETP